VLGEQNLGVAQKFKRRSGGERISRGIGEQFNLNKEVGDLRSGVADAVTRNTAIDPEECSEPVCEKEHNPTQCPRLPPNQSIHPGKIFSNAQEAG